MVACDRLAVGAACANESARFREYGYMVLRGLLQPAQVAALSDALALYVERRGSRVFNLSDVFLVSETKPRCSWFIPDIRSEPGPLADLFTLVDRSPQLRGTLETLLGGGAVRFLGRNEVLINRFLPWHRDKLDGALAAYTRAMDPWRSGYPVVTVGLFLQDHARDRLGLVVQPGTHRVRADGPYPPNHTHRVISSQLGDALVWDTRLWHRSGVESWSELAERRLKRAEHGSCSTAAMPRARRGAATAAAAGTSAGGRNSSGSLGSVIGSVTGSAAAADYRVARPTGSPFGRKQGERGQIQHSQSLSRSHLTIKPTMRSLLTLSYGPRNCFDDAHNGAWGEGACRFARAHESAMRMRYRLMVEPNALCGERGRNDAVCVRRTILDDMRRIHLLDGHGGRGSRGSSSASSSLSSSYM